MQKQKDKGSIWIFVLLCLTIMSTIGYVAYNNGVYNGRIEQCKDMGRILVVRNNIEESGQERACITIEEAEQDPNYRKYKGLMEIENNLPPR